VREINQNCVIEDCSELSGEGVDVILTDDTTASDEYEALFQFDSGAFGGTADSKIDAGWPMLQIEGVLGT